MIGYRLKKILEKKLVDPWKKLKKDCTDLEELVELIDPSEEVVIIEFRNELAILEEGIDALEFERVFSDPIDTSNAIISINAGAGGTESCDWVSMLYRMYQRWAELRGFSLELIDLLSGEDAGIKNVTFFVRGPMAYGNAKAERGVHRLVRISPFDSNSRRHTSFASVDVIAEITDAAIAIDIAESDLRIDTYRAGGAGGQHVNKTDSAVRITHIPTGVIVQCQNERSQHKNKSTAMKVLKAKLFQLEKEKEDSERQKQYGDKMEISWGSQIRSYVFHPYSMVKDHRTKFETSNTQAVMDGEICGFIKEYLKQAMTGEFAGLKK